MKFLKTVDGDFVVSMSHIIAMHRDFYEDENGFAGRVTARLTDGQWHVVYLSVVFDNEDAALEAAGAAMDAFAESWSS